MAPHSNTSNKEHGSTIYISKSIIYCVPAPILKYSSFWHSLLQMEKTGKYILKFSFYQANILESITCM